MMVNHLFLDAIENYPTRKILPFFTTLSDYEPGEKNLHYLLERSISRFNRKVRREDILSRLDDDLTVLLLDGLDEVKKEYVKQCIKDIEYFSDQFRGAGSSFHRGLCRIWRVWMGISRIFCVHSRRTRPLK